MSVLSGLLVGQLANIAGSQTYSDIIYRPVSVINVIRITVIGVDNGSHINKCVPITFTIELYLLIISRFVFSSFAL